MSAAAAEPYERLVAMIEDELELAGHGRFVELEQASRARTAFTDEFPVVPPASAYDALERAALLHKRLEIELARGREALLRTAASIQSARRAAGGYAPARHSGRRVSASA